MSTTKSRRMTAFVVCLGLALPAFLPGSLFGQAVQDGKWKLTSALPARTIYFNGSGAAQKVMLTLCVSGGEVRIATSAVTIGAVGAPECLTVSETLNSGQAFNVSLEPGTTGASGTYSVSVLP